MDDEDDYLNRMPDEINTYAVARKGAGSQPVMKTTLEAGRLSWSMGSLYFLHLLLLAAGYAFIQLASYSGSAGGPCINNLFLGGRAIYKQSFCRDEVDKYPSPVLFTP